MSKLIFCFSFLSLFHFIFKPCFEKINHWEQLKDTAHEIGLCVFSTQEVFCDEHKDERFRREPSVNSEEEDLYYFEMKEDWAKTRIEGRADFEKRIEKDYLIIFDVQQGPFDFIDSSKVEPSTKRFLMMNLKDEFSFFQKHKTDTYFECMIKCNQEYKILENIHWREFVTYREGRLSNEVSFAILNNSEKRNLDKFVEAFMFYQQYKK